MTSTHKFPSLLGVPPVAVGQQERLAPLLPQPSQQQRKTTVPAYVARQVEQRALFQLHGLQVDDVDGLSQVLRQGEKGIENVKSIFF